ncbi:MAG: hypothetical protein ACLRSW_01530 [Christensenellaceae bacterium]
MTTANMTTLVTGTHTSTHLVPALTLPPYRIEESEIFRITMSRRSARYFNKRG